ncbi:hypothetical protein YM304_14370 [Ilumatobacter coccineus YM16-304]|uniref:Uncharacterized protein n=2 Tax=Ilumatobacter coccineus TaxID=467094 RepID=A0A6C7E5A4_ILUCY|nr:hypothetical protein YM304_14370 [Ilumatobacter coccineus YM16-304]
MQRWTIEIRPLHLLNVLVGISGLFFVTHSVAVTLAIERGITGRGFIDKVNLGIDTAIPTWFAALLLFMSAVALLVVYRTSAAIDPRNGRHWLGLSVIFALLSIDEVAAIHEWVGDQGLIENRTGVLYYQWVVVGIAFVIAVGLVYLPFLARLDRRSRNLFVLSGALYVGGAVLMEMVNAAVGSATEDGERGLQYALQTGVEELFEMVGAAVFLYSVLDVLARRSVSVHIDVGAGQR